MPKRKPAKISIVAVVDQLRFDDAASLPLLRDATKIEVDCFPTLSETWHASLATLTPPRAHGVVGPNWFEDEGGLVRRHVLGSAVRPALLDALRAAGVRCCVFTGRQDLAHLLDPDLRADLRATYVRGSTDLQLEVLGGGRPLELDLCEATHACVRDLADPGVDETLLALALHAIDLAVADPVGQDTFVFLGLTGLDLIGHRKPRDGDETTRALGALEHGLRRLHSRLPRDFDAELVITSAHGCRATSRWVTLSSATGSAPAGFLISDEAGQRREVKLPDGVRSDEQGAPAVLLDGGTMRLWVEPEKVTKVVAALEAQLGQFLSHVFPTTAWPSGPALAWTTESQGNARWGDVVGIAKEDVALCRPHWPQPVVNEHGTHLEADRAVPFLQFCTKKQSRRSGGPRSLAEHVLWRFLTRREARVSVYQQLATSATTQTREESLELLLLLKGWIDEWTTCGHEEQEEFNQARAALSDSRGRSAADL